MNPTDFGPLLIVVSRDEVLRQDISGPIKTLRHLISNREIIRANMLNVDISFSGYEDTREELFEITEVRNYVYALDAQFPFWLYFLSRHFMGLQCLAYCHLLPFLTREARMERHPSQLADLIERRWGPALFEICSASGHSEAEAEVLLKSAMEYFASGPSVLVEGEDEDDDKNESTKSDVEGRITRLALLPTQEYVKRCLEKAARAAIARPDQDPHSLLLGALFLRAVVALPVGIDQFPIQLSWKIDHGDSWGMKTITIGHEALSLDTIEGFDSGQGWDHESSVEWSVDDSSQQGLDGWVLEDVLTAFARDVSSPECEVGFSSDYDHDYQEIANDPEPIKWQEAFGFDDE
jgi:hypothetical protein